MSGKKPILALKTSKVSLKKKVKNFVRSMACSSSTVVISSIRTSGMNKLEKAKAYMAQSAACMADAAAYSAAASAVLSRNTSSDEEEISVKDILLKDKGKAIMEATEELRKKEEKKKKKKKQEERMDTGPSKPSKPNKKSTLYHDTSLENAIREDEDEELATTEESEDDKIADAKTFFDPPAKPKRPIYPRGYPWKGELYGPKNV